MRLLLLTLMLSFGCRGGGADAGELRMARKRVKALGIKVDKLEASRLRDGCQVLDLLLRENAMQRIDLAGKLSRVKQVAQVLHVVSSQKKVGLSHHRTGSDIAERLRTNVKGGAPAFVFLLDRRSRVLARAGLHEDRYGDRLRHIGSVDAALHGFMRDDVWLLDKRLYRVAVAPVVFTELEFAYVGAVVVGHAMGRALLSDLGKRLRLGIGFYWPEGGAVRTSRVPAIDKRVRDVIDKLGPDRRTHCSSPATITTDSEDHYYLLAARLPGTAGLVGAAYAVFAKRTIRGPRAR